MMLPFLLIFRPTEPLRDANRLLIEPVYEVKHATP
jgi:hypothetical protein